MEDLYSRLGLAAEASVEEIKKSYRKLALRHHPDKGGDPEVFKQISEVRASACQSCRRSSALDAWRGWPCSPDPLAALPAGVRRPVRWREAADVRRNGRGRFRRL
jgi:DnaJ family protein A protein 2